MPEDALEDLMVAVVNDAQNGADDGGRMPGQMPGEDMLEDMFAPPAGGEGDHHDPPINLDDEEDQEEDADADGEEEVAVSTFWPFVRRAMSLT